MKRISLLLFLIALSVCIAAGCGGGSEKHIHVQEKTELNTDSYRQASDTPEDSEDPDSGSDSDSVPSSNNRSSDSGSGAVSGSTASDSGGNSGFLRREALARRLQISETSQFLKEYPQSSFPLSCKAEIELPDADQVSVCKVSQKPFDQEWIDRVTHVFFGGLPVYDYTSYQQPTKEWAREKLRRLRTFQAQGITDPYGHIASCRAGGSKNPEAVYNLEKDIEHWEQIYNEAPDTVQKVKVSPGFNPPASGSDAADDVFARSDFSGIVEMDGDVFQYFFKKSGPSHMEIQILRESGADPDETWFGYDWLPYASVSESDHAPSSEIKERIEKFTPSQAIEIADRYLEELGLSDFSAKYTEKSISYCMPEDLQAERIFIDGGYKIVYTRDINGFPITYELSPGCSIPSGQSPVNTWANESVEFYINQDGLQKASIRNLYEIEEVVADNIELLTFPEIMELFGQLMPICYSENVDSLTVDRITLGYARIYDPGMDSTTALLVPVWDFFGRTVIIADGEPRTLDDPAESLLTINAADGTVINRRY